MKRAAAIVVGAAGCSSLLGLDNTTFQNKDAMVDAPNVCDGAPACGGASGRSVCGQLFGAGSAAGLLRVAAPTGATCPAAGASSGPCQLGVFAAPTSDYYARMGANQTVGTVDDCGRFAINGIAASVGDLVVVAHNPPFVETATFVLGGGSGRATVSGVAAYAVPSDAAATWGSQLGGSGAAIGVTGGLLVEFGGALSGEQIRLGNTTVNAPPTLPWGAYFAGAPVFGELDATLTAGAANASALVMPASSPFSLGGARIGQTCNAASMLQTVPNVLMAITIPGC